MLDRVAALVVFWGLRGGLAWFVMHEYAAAVTQRLDEVLRAFNGL